MSSSGKYIVYSIGKVSFIDLGFDFAELTLSGQAIEFAGSSGVDTVALGSGVSLDFSNSFAEQDRIYFRGTWSDYADGLTFPSGETGFDLSLTREVNGQVESALFRRAFNEALSDNLVFSDGVINARTMASQKGEAVPDATGETSLNPDLPDSFSSTVRMIDYTNEGLTFGQVGAGMTQLVTGGRGVDKVYVADGVICDATNLLNEKDIIYLRGRFPDYVKDASTFGRLVFTRDHDDDPATPNEMVIVAAAFGSSDDMVVFADGAVASTRTLWQTLSAAEDPNGVTTEDLGSTWDATTTTPGVSNAPYVKSFDTPAADGIYGTGDSITIVATMSEDVSSGSTFNVTLDSGAVVTLTAASDGTELTGTYTIGESDTSSDLTVASYTAGSVTDLDGNAMVSTDLPGASSNIAANHDIMINVDSMELTSPMAEAAALDVRSDIVLQGSAALSFGADGAYEIRLVDTGAGEEGFDGETGDGSITLSVTLAGGAVTEVTGGGSVSIDAEGNLVISLDRDLDLATAYELSVDMGLVEDGNGLQSAAVESLSFSTVDPTVEGTVASIWDGAALADGATWYDGTGGSFVQNENGLAADLSGVSGVVVIGHDVDPGEGVVLADTARTILTGFGGDDYLYVDNALDAGLNVYDRDNIVIGAIEGTSYTPLTFSSEQGGQAGVLIGFADDAATAGIDESLQTAVAFANDPGMLDSEHSFESLTGNATPVIGG